MKTHPLADLFPAMTPTEYRDLKASIKSRGFDATKPVTTYEGRILDGRHRYRACRELGIEPVVRDFTDGDALAFVLAENLDRRHLDPSQRALVAARLATLKHGVKKADA